MRIEILILAAGKSSRMGGINKLLRTSSSLRLVELVINEANKSAADQISIIIPAEKSDLWGFLDNYPVNQLRKDDTNHGIGYSIACGIEAIKERYPDGVIILLADMPEIKATHLDLMIKTFFDNPKNEIIRATSSTGIPGNPVLFSKKYFNYLTKLKGDIGAKTIIKKNLGVVQDLPLPRNAAMIDLDTPYDWDRWYNENKVR